MKATAPLTSPPDRLRIFWNLGNHNWMVQGTGVELPIFKFIMYSNPPADQASYSVDSVAKFGEINKPTIAAYDVKGDVNPRPRWANTDPL